LYYLDRDYQTFISLAITLQNKKIVRHSDAPISPKYASRPEAENGTVGAKINGEVNFAQLFSAYSLP
jgi:hypothetical protein